MPAFPDVAVQRSTTALEGNAALRQAFDFYEDVHDALTTARIDLDPGMKVLDFGVGWGRIARCLLRDVPVSNLFGLDVDSASVEFCRRAFQASGFYESDPFPPTHFTDGYFNLVFAYSVFSHLSERACLAWVHEFARILRPGGLFAFTTRSESFLDHCARAASLATHAAINDYERSLAVLFPDIEEARRKFRAGELVHRTSGGVSGGGPKTEAFYGETLIPVPYVRKAFGEHFALLRTRNQPERYDQVFFALIRR